MAFGDFLKNAIRQGKEMVEAQAAAAQARKEREAAVRPECDKGECYHIRGGFFCFCDDATQCPEKKQRKDYTYTLKHPDALPILRKCALAEKISEDSVLSEDFARAERLVEEAIDEYMAKFLPNFKCNENNRFLIQDFVLTAEGLAGRGVASLFEKLKEYNPDDFDDFADKMRIISNYGVGAACGRHVGFIDPQDDFLATYSVLNRSVVDFEFTLVLYAVISDRALLRKYYRDTTEIQLSALYDERGDVKPVGTAEDGKDSLLGLIDSWKTDDECKDNLVGDDLIVLYEKMAGHQLPTVDEIMSSVFSALK